MNPALGINVSLRILFLFCYLDSMSTVFPLNLFFFFCLVSLADIITCFGRAGQELFLGFSLVQMTALANGNQSQRAGVSLSWNQSN